MISSKAQEAIAAGIAAMRERAVRPARNDPAGYERVTAVREDIGVLLRGGRSVPLDPAAVEAYLLAAAAALPEAAACSPGQALRLNGAALSLSQAARTGAEKDAESARFLEPGVMQAGGLDFVYRDQPGVRAMHRVSTERESVFPHGLCPPPPAWPAELAAVVSGLGRAEAAYRDLHDSGWQRAFEHYSFAMLTAMTEVTPWFEAALAFARVAAGPSAEAQVRRSYRGVVLRLEGPDAALRLLEPPSQWRPAGYLDGGSDVGCAEDVLVALMKAADWTTARGLVDQIFSREDLLGPEQRTRMVKRRLRIEKALDVGGPAPRSRRGSAGSEDRRPGRQALVAAPARPPAAQAIVDAAGAGDSEAAGFLASMDQDRFHGELLHDAGAVLTAGHLWLLHELDNQSVNGKLFVHPAADEALRVSILSRARHAATGTAPRLSWYVLNAVREHADLLPLVLAHGTDPELVSGALAAHGAHADPVDVAALALRTLDLPAARAVALLDAVVRHAGAVLPPALLRAVKDAVRDAHGDPVDRPSLRRSLAALAAAPRRQAPTPVEEDAEAQDAVLVAALERTQDASQAGRLLRDWARPLPWDALCASVRAGRLGSEAIRRLTDRQDAPPEMLRLAVRSWSPLVPRPWILDPAVTWRWLEPLLSEPVPSDAASVTARIELSAHALVHDPRDVEVRLPRPELVVAATQLVRWGLPAAGAGHPTRIWDLAVGWWADGLLEPLPLMAELPLPVVFGLLREVSGADAADAGALPEPVRIWLEEGLADPEWGIEPSLAPTVRDRVSTWQGSLEDLVSWAEERSWPEEADAVSVDVGEEPEVLSPPARTAEAPAGPRSLVRYAGTSQLVEVDPATADGVAILTAPRIELMHGQAAAVVLPAADGEQELSADAVSLILGCFGGEKSTTGGVVWFGSPAGAELGSAPGVLVEQLLEMDRARERRRRR